MITTFGITELVTNLLPGEFWQQVYFGNSLGQYLAAIVIFAILWLLFWLIQKSVLLRLHALAKKTSTDIDDTAVKIVTGIKPPFYWTLAAWLAIKTLSLSSLINQVADGIVIIVIVYQVIASLKVLIDYVVRKRISKAGEEEEETNEDKKNLEAALGIVNKIATFILWAIGFLFVLSNFGINVTSLIASLGIGGIAVALAAQNVLSDLFSSLAIYFDKPFQIGDFIVTGNTAGTVKHIGIKTTRIKSIDGEEIILANQELTKAKIQNFKRMEKRRVAFDIGVTYNTAADKLEKIPTIVKKIIEEQESADFDRTHFKSFGDSALIFEIVYHVTESGYEKYMNIQQAINLGLTREFATLGIEFAYPTQKIYLEQGSK